MKKLLTTALLLLTMVGSATPSFAVTDADAIAANQLIQALNARGITLYLDADQCDDGTLDGFYMGRPRVLVLCNKGSREMTERALNTLRHEAVHFIQDCRDGAIDHELNLIMKPGTAERILRENGWSPERIKEVYSANGKGSHVPFEYEAFAGGLMPTSTILNVMNAMCPLL